MVSHQLRISQNNYKVLMTILKYPLSGKTLVATKELEKLAETHQTIIKLPSPPHMIQVPGISSLILKCPLSNKDMNKDKELFVDHKKVTVLV